MAIFTNDNARNEAGADVDQAGGLEMTYQTRQEQCSTDSTVLKSRSTNTEAQRAKLLASLRVGPQTTIQLRERGIMMPATRVFELKKLGHVITSELITQYDHNGFLHPKCARYHLVQDATNQPGPEVSDA
jgi:hypothetical protein